MTQWKIKFTNGETELTPLKGDKLRISPDSRLLMCQRSSSYGPDETVKTYVMCNIQSWVEDR